MVCKTCCPLKTLTDVARHTYIHSFTTYIFETTDNSLTIANINNYNEQVDFYSLSSGCNFSIPRNLSCQTILH